MSTCELLNRAEGSAELVPNSVRDFVADELTETNWYYTPEPMTTDEAAYCIKCYREEEFEIPEGLTPELFAQEWNRQINERYRRA